jgi:hypothetical protein
MFSFGFATGLVCAMYSEWNYRVYQYLSDFTTFFATICCR